MNDGAISAGTERVGIAATNPPELPNRVNDGSAPPPNDLPTTLAVNDLHRQSVLNEQGLQATMQRARIGGRPQDETRQPYNGGTVHVPVSSDSTQAQVLRHGLMLHASRAGLPPAEQVAFADSWMSEYERTGQAELQDARTHRRIGAREFAADKRDGRVAVTLEPQRHEPIIADLRQRAARIEEARRLAESQHERPSMGPLQQTDSERLIGQATSAIDDVAGRLPDYLSDPLSRGAIGLVHLGGTVAELQADFQRRVHDVGRAIVPESVGEMLTAQDARNRELAEALTRAQSEVTSEDAANDRMLERAGIEVPLIARVARDLPRAPEIVSGVVPDIAEGAVYGEFSDNRSAGAEVGRVASGFVPGLGQAGDARDITAAGVDVAQGEEGSWARLGISVAAIIPGLDILKGGRRLMREAAQEGVEETAEIVARRTARETEVAERLTELARQGHGPQRHGSYLTQQQLEDRAMRGFDPMTGTREDAFIRLPDGSPAPHQPTRHATQITSDEAYVAAERYIRNSQQFHDAITAAEAAGVNEIALRGVHLEDIYGVDYRQHVYGQTRLGSFNNPAGVVGTDFSDGTMRAIYRRDSNGNWNLHTMFPEPKQ